MTRAARAIRATSTARAARAIRSAEPQSVLYDAPGPRARRRTMIVTVLAGVAVSLLALVALSRLQAQGQFEGELWAPLLDPRHELFGQVWKFLGGGLARTLLAAALAMSISLMVGTMVAATRWLLGRWGGRVVAAIVELVRGVPVVLAIFFAARALPEFGIDLPALWYVVIGLVAYNAVVIAEVLRAGLAALPRGQSEAALALGMTRPQVLFSVLLPQAFRIMLPALISQLVVVLKDTSLGFIVAFPELVRRAQILIQNTDNPIQTFTVVGAIFVVLNLMVSSAVERVQRSLAASTR